MTEAAAQIRADGIEQLLNTRAEEIEKREHIFHGLNALTSIEWAIQEAIKDNEPGIIPAA